MTVKDEQQGGQTPVALGVVDDALADRLLPGGRQERPGGGGVGPWPYLARAGPTTAGREPEESLMPDAGPGVR